MSSHEQTRAATFQCSVCRFPVIRECFSGTQFKLGKRRRCSRCVSIIQAAGAAGQVQLADHRTSRGRIDGTKHRHPGRKTRDRSARANPVDLESARRAITAFQELFSLASWSPVPRLPVWFDCVTLQPSSEYALSPLCSSDFITTIQEGKLHTPLAAMATSNPNDVWEVGQLQDAPSASAFYPLKFCCTAPAQFYMTHMSPKAIVRHPGGTLLFDGTIPVAGRAPCKLYPEVCVELIRVYYELAKLREYRPRGCHCASICR